MRSCEDCTHHERFLEYDRGHAYDMERCELTCEVTTDGMEPCEDFEPDVDTPKPVTDSRDLLEYDVRSSLGFTTGDVIGWLDRQAAITERECAMAEADRLHEQMKRHERQRDELQSEIDAIKNLRDYWKLHADCWADKHAELQAKLDSYDETHVLLPLDADGVPIRIGDMLTENGDPCKFEVMSLTYYEDCVDVNACGANPKLCTHVKPRTIEDVLRDAGVSVAAIEDVAAEIRELMEVGE